MVQLQDRRSWTSRANDATRQEGPRRGVAVHWPGFRFTLADHAGCLRLLASMERQAVQNGYAALPYNQAACPHGYLIDGRGASRRAGANGSLTANLRYGSVVALLPVGGTPTDGMLEALRNSLEVQAPGGRLVPHAEVRATSTACPGPELSRWLRAGAPAPRPTGRVHVVVRGETLWALAQRYYGDGAQWKRIAAANDLSGSDVQPGDRLTIPGQP